MLEIIVILMGIAFGLLVILRKPFMRELNEYLGPVQKVE